MAEKAMNVDDRAKWQALIKEEAEENGAPCHKGQNLNLDLIRLLALYLILSENTDSTKILTTSELTQKMNALGLQLNVKKLNSDYIPRINNLFSMMESPAHINTVTPAERREDFGVEKPGHENAFYIDCNYIEKTDAELLIDIVNSTSVLSERNTKTLINTIAHISTISEGELEAKLKSVKSKVNKATNPDIPNNIRIVQQAIAEEKRIKFRYFNMRYDAEQKKNTKIYYDKSGNETLDSSKFIHASPLWIMVSNNNYYAIVHWDLNETNEGTGTRWGISPIRIDRMEKAVMLNKKISKKKLETWRKEFDEHGYAFNMFYEKSTTKNVRLRFNEKMFNPIFDRFGEENVKADIRYRGKSEDGQHRYYELTRKIDTTPPFYAWVFQMGENLKIVGPDEVVKEYQRMLYRALEIY